MTLPSSLNSSWQAVVLDDKGCLSLDKILQVFSAPITEVHAWAILHQVATSLLNYSSSVTFKLSDIILSE